MRGLNYGLTRLFVIALLAALPFSFSHSQNPPYDIDSMSRAAVQVRVDDGTGSGTLVIIEGIPTVFTNRHVVEGFNEATIAVLTDVNAPAEPKFIARLIGFSEIYDFAVYTIASDMQGNIVRASDLRSGRFGIRVPDIRIQDVANQDSDVRRGDVVGVFGYPGIGDDELVYTTGIISSVQFGEYDGQRLPMWYRTNAEMSPGNSGGMALNARGEFIGIPTSVRTEYETGGRLGSLLAVPFVMAILNDDDGLLASWSDSDSNFTGRLNLSLDPYFGSVELIAGFIPDPHVVTVSAGGSVDVTSGAYGDDCRGYASTAPDFKLIWSGDSSRLQIFFVAGDNSDATLIVNGPDGSWLCNDDAAGTLNPGITVNSPGNGRYDIWVGAYSQGEYIGGELRITELTTDVP